MNKADVVSAVRIATGLDTNNARAAVDSVFSTILSALANDDTVVITNFGVFNTEHKSESTRIDPRNGNKVIVPDRSVPRFRFAESVRLRFRKMK